MAKSAIRRRDAGNLGHGIKAATGFWYENQEEEPARKRSHVADRVPPRRGRNCISFVYPFRGAVVEGPPERADSARVSSLVPIVQPIDPSIAR